MPNAKAIGTPLATNNATPRTKKIARFQWRRLTNRGRASQRAAQISAATVMLAARKRALGAVATSRSAAKIAIRLAPAGNAAERHELLMPRPGVRTIASSIAYSIAG